MRDLNVNVWIALFLQLLFVFSSQLHAQSSGKKRVKGKPIKKHLEVEWLSVNLKCSDYQNGVIFPDEMIINDSNVYNDLRDQIVFAEDIKDNKQCIRNLPDIDFSKYSVIWCEIEYGGCYASMNGDAEFGMNDSGYILNIKIDHGHCRAIVHTKVLFKVSKIPQNAQIEFQRFGTLTKGRFSRKK